MRFIERQLGRFFPGTKPEKLGFGTQIQDHTALDQEEVSNDQSQVDTAETGQETETPDSRIPLKVLQQIKSQRSPRELVPQYSEWEVLRTLAAIALCDRNYRVSRWVEGRKLGKDERQKTVVNQRWESIRFKAIDEIGSFDNKSAAMLLYKIEGATNLATNWVKGDSNEFGEIASKDIGLVKRLVSPLYEKFFESLSVSWYPWSQTWRDGEFYMDLEDIDVDFRSYDRKSSARISRIHSDFKNHAIKVLGEMKDPEGAKMLFRLALLSKSDLASSILINKALASQDEIDRLRKLPFDDRLKTANDFQIPSQAEMYLAV